ncbi:hypothetical protein ACGTJS_10715 [Faucicola mancuniensis]|uniref:hypothetical protein n=1 Tax=Faucicola mancuniensis TaxID=1309795 RepID=UPI0028E559F0|nr:hypothetical protein [uncultured Moraxella sp.]
MFKFIKNCIKRLFSPFQTSRKIEKPLDTKLVYCDSQNQLIEIDKYRNKFIFRTHDGWNECIFTISSKYEIEKIVDFIRD